MGKKIKIRIRNDHPGSYLRELRNNFFKIKKLHFFLCGSGACIWDGKNRIRDGKIRIRDKHPGSATLNTIMIHLHAVYTTQVIGKTDA
jgi:hypothetical protein